MLEAEGLAEHERHRGARVPSLSMHEVDVMYRMREQLEQLAIAESIPHLTDAESATSSRSRSEIEAGATTTPTASSSWTGSSTSAATPAAGSSS